MINAYDKTYLDRAKRVLAIMLDYAVNILDYDIAVFFNMFITSTYAKRFEMGDPSIIAGKSGIEIVHEIIKNKNEDFMLCEPYFIGERSKEYWLGWALAYYQWKVALSFKEISNFIPIKDMLLLYTPYHEMDIEKFVDKLNELYLKENVNTKLKTRRLKLGLSQQQLAILSNVPKRTIQQYEQRKKNISKANGEHLIMLSRALGCEVIDLIDTI